MRLPRLLHLPSSRGGPQDCRCGHGQPAHEHYRRGTDCALCQCPRFRAPSAPRRESRRTRDDEARVA